MGRYTSTEVANPDETRDIMPIKKKSQYAKYFIRTNE